jgi:hypothetical protein
MPASFLLRLTSSDLRLACRRSLRVSAVTTRPLGPRRISRLFFSLASFHTNSSCHGKRLKQRSLKRGYCEPFSVTPVSERRALTRIVGITWGLLTSQGLHRHQCLFRSGPNRIELPNLICTFRCTFHVPGNIVRIIRPRHPISPCISHASKLTPPSTHNRLDVP